MENIGSLTTVDSIVRSYIQEKGMVLHDYFRLLSIAIRAVKHLAMDMNIGTNIKVLEIEVDRSGSAYLPTDCVELRMVSVEEGDRLLGMSEDDRINPVRKVGDDGDFEKRNPRRQISDKFLPSLDPYVLSRINDKGESLGRMYGTPHEQKWVYKKTGNRIQFDARLDIDCVYVLYTSTGVSMGSANVIHPWCEEAVKAFMDWKWTDARKGIWENQNERRYFFTEKRNAKARIHGLSFEDYLRIIREKGILTFKA